MGSRVRFVVLGLVVSAGVVAGPAGVTAAAPSGVTALQPTYGAAVVEPQDPNRQYRAMPSLQYVTWTDPAGVTRHRFVRSFQVSADGDPAVKLRIEYQDGAGKWQAALDARTGGPLLNATDAQFAKVGNVFTATNGDLVAVEELGRVDAAGKRYAVRWTSADGGVGWRPSRADLDFTGGTISSGTGRLFQGVLTLPDGSEVVPFYAAHQGTLSAAYLLSGNHDGTAWKRASTVFLSGTYNYTEATVTRRADGRLLMVTRLDQMSGGYAYSRLLGRVTTAPVNSAADLATAGWGAAYALKVPGAADENAVRGVNPVLHTMDQGVLMLVFGRPRNKITFSYDGGTTWSTVHSFYDNLPTGCSGGYGVHPCDTLGSSGYQGVAVTGPRTAKVMGDNCQSGWGCAGAYAYPNTTDDRLWSATVTLS